MSIKIESIKDESTVNIVAVKTIANNLSIGILAIEYGITDKVVWTAIYDNNYLKVYKSDIIYDERDYFTFKDDVHYLDEFIRV